MVVPDYNDEMSALEIEVALMRAHRVLNLIAKVIGPNKSSGAFHELEDDDRATIEEILVDTAATICGATDSFERLQVKKKGAR